MACPENDIDWTLCFISQKSKEDEKPRGTFKRRQSLMSFFTKFHEINALDATLH